MVLGKNTTSHNYYWNYYYRIDPQFDEHNRSGYSDNLKELCLSEVAGDAYGGTFGFYNWCTNSVPDNNYTGTVLMSRMPVTPANRDLPYGCSGDNRVYHNNPINGWIKMQWEGEYDTGNNAPKVALTTYPDGARADRSHYGDGLTTDNYVMNNPGMPKLNDLELVGIGGFARIPRQNNGVNSFRYFAAIYMDYTYSRVMLGDQPDYDSCTIMEPQIPTHWADTAITVTLNQGSLPEGPAYLYIFDMNNRRNTQGFQVIVDNSSVLRPEEPQHLRLRN